MRQASSWSTRSARRAAFSYPDLRQGWRRAPLVLKTNYLLAHVLQQLLGDIASIPHIPPQPFLGFRPIRPCLDIDREEIWAYASVSGVRLSR